MDASTNLDIPAEMPVAQAEAEKPKGFQLDWDQIRKSPAFYPGVALILSIGLMFWGLFRNLPPLWFGEDGYYSHGVLVPLISGYVIYRWWPNLKKIPVKPSYLAAIPLVAILFVARASVANSVDPVSSALLIVTLLCCVAFIAGWRWMLAVSLPTFYLAFALPMWNMAITYYTNPLQVLSTKVAHRMLDFTGFAPLKEGNIIYLNGFTLDVGVPCSGLKLVLALYAFTVFFALIAKLRWWANLIMVVLIPLPLALFVNGLRIMLIGVVGVNYGPDAGHQFHDYSGYIALVVCFFILFKTARLLGWKD